MAYKTFANGFPLPASDLNNFLMNQSVIVFADSAARTTAIPSPVTGMLTYLEDTSAYESWNGSAYVALVEDPDLTSLIPKSTVTTAQDLIVADGASSVTRLGVGTDDQVLSVVAGEVAWADGGAGGNYYNITAAGTYTVDLAAGLYGYASTLPVNVGGVFIDGAGLANYASTITSIITINGVDWTARTSGFGSTRILGVTYGDGLYVAVGNDGKLTTSPDGTTWTARTSGFGTTTIRGVTFGDGLYVAVGDSGKLTTSPDGTTWTTRTSGFGTTRIWGVTYGDGLYVAVGESGKLTTSTDGITWTTRTSGFGSTTIIGVTYGDGLYVAGGNDGTMTTSTDGTTWTTRTSGFGATDIYGVTHGDGLYVAGGDDGKLTTSTDGITWTTRTSGFGTTPIWGVTHGDALYVAVGDDGDLTTSPDGTGYLSLELKTPVTTLS